METIQDIRFTADEIKLLKELRSIEEAAGLVASVLKSAPIIQLLSAPNPVDMFITIGSSDWDKMPAALLSLSKIRACELKKAVEFYMIDHTFTGKAKQFFDELYASYDRQCSG